MSLLSTVPAVLQWGSPEALPLSNDVSAQVTGTDTVTAAVCTLTDLTTNVAFPAGLSGSATFTGKTVTQTLTGLQPFHRYRLVWQVTATGPKTYASETEIDCIW